ncbi:2-oxoglutarate and iron-dependent oxygenase domain-containing protein 3-like [Pectinophora gossypiella]|uniref:2-oxoglutarate and iron-dependent oxygenase domain-containing protein 3-like n=1 Tax=Pectinophora gossypiella TaxID=13191 RepID=UPI00214E50C8|nr:2-oxoglutarate and iron-dependent oxygenase domain-containing protein 3-like [Pectinophora gossypiella]
MSDVKKRKNVSATVDKNGDKSASEAKIHDKPATSDNKLMLRVLSRIVVITSLLIVVYFSTKEENIKPFARQSDILPGKGQIVECSTSYLREVERYEGCYPKDCKRYVTDQVISVREAEDLLEMAKKGFKVGGSAGGASILDLHSGALSKGTHYINIYKNEDTKNLFTENDFNIYRVVKEKIRYAVGHHFGISPNKIYLTHTTFFSELTAKKAAGIHDEYWHPHVDKETYPHFHYTTLLYLGDYNIDFKGGRFVFIDEKFNRTVEPRKGRLSMFTSGAENRHYVEKVSSGIRYAITVSFTCDKNHAIEDPSINKYLN